MANQDIFGNAFDFGGAFKAALASVSFSTVGSADIGLGLLVQNLQANYSQQITRVWELSSARTYYIAGRAMGQMSIGRIVGPQAVSANFVSDFGNVCNARGNTLIINPSAGVCPPDTAANVKRVFNNCVITGLGMSVQSQDMVVSENLQMLYSAMSTG